MNSTCRLILLSRVHTPSISNLGRASQGGWAAIQSAQLLQQKQQGVTEFVAIVCIVKVAGFTISAVELQIAQARFLTNIWMVPLAAGVNMDL